MQYTNVANLPDAIVKAVTKDPYSKGDADYSVTELLKPPRVAALEKLHADKLTEDVSDRIWSLLGQIMHGLLERAEGKAIVERRLIAEIAGKKVSGGMDRYEDGLLQDYKLTSVYKVKDDQIPREWEEQLNSYAHLLRVHGFSVKALEVVAVLRDWSKLEARRSSHYPQVQVQKITIPLWTKEEAESFLVTRVLLHDGTKSHLPQCSDKERWAKEPIYAVKRPDRKSAIRLFQTEKEATAFLGEAGKNAFIEFRPGENVRCDSYCRVAPFCSQYEILRQTRA